MLTHTTFTTPPSPPPSRFWRTRHPWLSTGLPLNVGLLLMAAIFAYSLYSAFWPFRTLEPRVQPYRILTSVVRGGQPLIYEADYCKRTNAPAVVTRTLYGDTGTFISLPTIATNLPPGCHVVQSATTVVPATAPPGRYTLELTLTYHVNALRDITVKVRTEKFTVAR